MIKDIEKGNDVLMMDVLQKFYFTESTFRVRGRLKRFVELFDGNFCVCFCVQCRAKIRMK